MLQSRKRPAAAGFHYVDVYVPKGFLFDAKDAPRGPTSGAGHFTLCSLSTTCENFWCAFFRGLVFISKLLSFCETQFFFVRRKCILGFELLILLKIRPFVLPKNLSSGVVRPGLGSRTARAHQNDAKSTELWTEIQTSPISKKLEHGSLSRKFTIKFLL